MTDQLPTPHGGGRHVLPSSPGDRVVSVLLGVLWFVASIAAPVIGFVVTGVSGSERPGSLPWQQPGAGAALVGLCSFLFVFIVGAQISLVREFRRHPGRRVRPRGSSRAYMIPELLRRNVLISILMIPGIAVGLWLRHRYG